ncbi:MAG: hypothetical protein JNK74_26030 [Candidatus Hydrogenedentes bacterium]|nr:hypothetical protein [Candidatus Hydrogenedentota bacterium]
MLRNIKLVGVLVSLGVLSSLPVNAAIFNDISISGTLDSSAVIFTPSTEDVVNGDVEFSSVLDVNDNSATAMASFNFDEFAGGLNLRALFEGQTATTYTVNAFSVTFTNIINSTPGSSFSSIAFIGDSDFDSSSPDYLSGVTISNFVDDPLQGISFTLDFSDFDVEIYSRHVELEILYRIDDPNSSVVPVPAAAPMALLGLGVLALARRFRRKTS